MKKIIGFLVPKNKIKNITNNVNLPETIESPIYEGQKIGEIEYFVDGIKTSSVNLIAKNTVKKISFANLLAHTLNKWLNLLRD